MPRSHKEVETLLLKLEQIMRDSGLWCSVRPAHEALCSPLPFACDTLSFVQWLQFIFIPKMTQLVIAKARLPEQLILLPVAQQSPERALYCPSFIKVIEQIDHTFSES